MLALARPLQAPASVGPPLSPRGPKTRGKKHEIRPWREDRSLEHCAQDAQYVGSPEHKDYVSPVLQEAPRPRDESDGSRCQEYTAEEWDRFTASLRAAIRAGCVSKCDAGGWPRRVWGYHEGKLFQARHRTDRPGNRYKGWWIELEERPKDREDRLSALHATLRSTP